MKLSNDKIPECHDQLCHHCGYLGTELQDVCEDCGLQTHTECYCMLDDKCHVCTTDLPKDTTLAEDPADRKEILRKMLCALCQQEDPPESYGPKSTDRLRPRWATAAPMSSRRPCQQSGGTCRDLPTMRRPVRMRRTAPGWWRPCGRPTAPSMRRRALDDWHHVIISDTLQYRPLPLVVTLSAQPACAAPSGGAL